MRINYISKQAAMTLCESHGLKFTDFLDWLLWRDPFIALIDAFGEYPKCNYDRRNLLEEAIETNKYRILNTDVLEFTGHDLSKGEME